jgi:hypothetical protein
VHEWIQLLKDVRVEAPGIEPGSALWADQGQVERFKNVMATAAALDICRPRRSRSSPLPRLGRSFENVTQALNDIVNAGIAQPEHDHAGAWLNPEPHELAEI